MLKYTCGNEVMVGDTVLRFDSNDGVLAVGEYVVKAIRHLHCDITLDVKGESRNFSTEYFNLISRKEETTMKTKQFTKADLKTGMRVTTRNGENWTVLKDMPSQTTRDEPEGILAQSGGWMDISGLDDNLVYTDNTQYSIEKVEVVEFYMDYLSKNPRKLVVWEREAPKSKEQIAYDEAVEATEAARQAYELAQKKLEALNPSNKG